jgi:hypothetical protein
LVKSVVHFGWHFSCPEFQPRVWPLAVQVTICAFYDYLADSLRNGLN